jgi:hypothetical protein
MPVRLPVQHRVQVDAPPQLGYATDLSAGGLFLELERPVSAPLALNDTVQIAFAPTPGGHPLEAYCRVARVTATGIGLHFIQLQPADAARLIRALNVGRAPRRSVELPH